jgi:hypothetical protein
MIVLTLSGWQQTSALQTNRLAGYPGNTRSSPQEPASDPSTQIESLPAATQEQVAESYLEDRFIGWQAAGIGAGAARLSNDLRANWVMVDDNGLLTGQVLGLKEVEPIPEPQNQPADSGPVPATDPNPPANPGAAAAQRGMDIFLLQRGKLVGVTRLDPQNRFEFQGVKPGSYSLVGYGPSGFFAFGFNALMYGDAENQPRELYIPAMASSGKPITDWVTRAAPFVHFRPFGKIRFGEGGTDPPRLFGIEGLQTFTPDAEPSTTVVSHPVSTTADGRLVGRIHHIHSLNGRPLDLRTTTVQLVRDGKVAHQTGTDNYGVFELANVAAGSYELFATGPDGLAGIQIEVVSTDEPRAMPVDLALINSETIGWLNHYMHESAYFAAISGPRPDSDCDRCGRRCRHCGGCGCGDHPCQCGQSGYGGYGDGYGNGYGGYDYGTGYGNDPYYGDQGGYGFGGNYGMYPGH